MARKMKPNRAKTINYTAHGHTEALELDGFLRKVLPDAELNGIIGRLADALDREQVPWPQDDGYTEPCSWALNTYHRRKKSRLYPTREVLEVAHQEFQLDRFGYSLLDLEVGFGLLNPEGTEEAIAETSARLRELRKIAKAFPHPGVTATREGVKTERRLSVRDDDVRMDAPPL